MHQLLLKNILVLLHLLLMMISSTIHYLCAALEFHILILADWGWLSNLILLHHYKPQHERVADTTLELIWHQPLTLSSLSQHYLISDRHTTPVEESFKTTWCVQNISRVWYVSLTETTHNLNNQNESENDFILTHSDKICFIKEVSWYFSFFNR